MIRNERVHGIDDLSVKPRFSRGFGSWNVSADVNRMNKTSE